MFETGITSYKHCTAQVDVYFPVDEKGNAHIYCEMCEFFGRSSRRCSLTGRISEFPGKYVGSFCPLKEIDNE